MKKRICFDLLVIFLLGLLPILWLPGKTLLFGHDSGIPFDPVIHFLDRFSVWSQRLGIGTDQSYGLLGATFIHAIEALLIWLGFPLEMEQKIQFVFWFVLPGFTMYYFVHKIWPYKKYLPLIASVIYMINYYLIQGWFVAERTKFSIYAAVPLVVYFTLSYLHEKMSFKKSVIAIGITLGLLNGGGSFPLYGGLLIIMGIILLYENFVCFGKETIKGTIFFSVGVSVLYVLLNAYWIFPYVYYILGFYGRDLALAGGPEGALAWTNYLSKGSTFINLFRGQGIPEWYLNPYHAFASNFLTNPLLILASFAYPLLAYSALFFAKDRRDKFYIYLFTLITFFTLIFASGSRSQLGIIYEAMVRYVPGFAIFRSAFYKFNYSLWFTYGILIGFTLDTLLSKLETGMGRIKTALATSIVPRLFLVAFIVGYVFYHYPVLNGSFLDYSHEPGKELTTRIQVPQYVFDFGKWVNQQDFTKRYLIVPEVSETGYIAYQWGYWSTAPINSLMAKNSFIQNTFLVPESERFLMKQMYTAFLRRDIKSFSDFAEVFAIDGIVVHEDFDWKNKMWGTTDPAIYEEILDSDPHFALNKTFGRWKVYDIVDRNKSLRVTVTPKLNFLQGKLENVVSFPEFDPTSPLFMADMESKHFSYFSNEATDVFIAPECIQCDLKEEFFGFNYYNPKVLPGSVIYPLIIYRENLIRQKSKDFASLLNYHLTTSDRRIVEAKWMVDSKEKVQFLQRAVDGYYLSIVQLKDLVSKEWGVTGKDENRLARTINGHLLQQVTLIDSIFENPMLNIEHRRVLALVYDEILKIKEVADKKQWVTEDITDKRYIFDLPKTGTYDIYAKKKSLSDPTGDNSNSTIVFADDNVPLKPISEKSDWLYFGKIDLKTKQVRLAFKDATIKNLLDSVHPEFPDGDQGIIEESKKFSMNLDSRNKCFTYTASNLETLGTQYLVSFSYRNLTDKKDLGFYVSHTEEKIPKLRIRESFIPNSRAWANHYEIAIPARNSIILNFCNGFVSISQKNSVKEREDLKFISPGQNLIEIQDISLYKISFPVIVFYQKQKDTEKKEYVINFQKMNPVEYEINVAASSDPVTLVMRESYGKYWELCEEENKCLPFDDKSHFISAGFTNGWYFKNGIGGKIRLFYFPQRMYERGAYLTAFTLIILLGGICWKVFRKK